MAARRKRRVGGRGRSAAGIAGTWPQAARRRNSPGSPPLTHTLRPPPLMGAQRESTAPAEPVPGRKRPGGGAIPLRPPFPRASASAVSGVPTARRKSRGEGGGWFAPASRGPGRKRPGASQPPSSPLHPQFRSVAGGRAPTDRPAGAAAVLTPRTPVPQRPSAFGIRGVSNGLAAGRPSRRCPVPGSVAQLRAAHRAPLRRKGGGRASPRTPFHPVRSVTPPACASGRARPPAGDRRVRLASRTRGS
jgi:hypothetical protein